MAQDFLKKTQHRPFPLPESAWVMSQSWTKLLFAHWPVPAETLRSLIPPSLDIDLFEGKAWIGVVPFLMRDVGPRLLPKVGAISNFMELNVRTYVTYKDLAGVYFFSLDCSNPIAVWVAKNLYHLPYFNAAMSYTEQNGWIEYESKRSGGGSCFSGRYRGSGKTVPAPPGSVDHFLTERYCLYTTDHKNNLYQGVIHHDVWPLQEAQADIRVNTMVGSTLGFKLPDEKPLLHYAENIDTVEWPIKLVQ